MIFLRKWPTATFLIFLLFFSKAFAASSPEATLEEGSGLKMEAQKGEEEEKNAAAVFRVFRIFARTWDDVRAVSALRAIAQENPEIDFWLDSVHPGQFADVMVSPNGMAIFRRFLRSNPSLKVQITVEDVEKLILRNEFRPRLERMARLRRRRLKRAKEPRRIQKRSIPSPLFDQLHGAHYPFGEYTGYAAMIRYLRTLEFYYPNLVQLIQIGASHEGRSIEGVKIGHNPPERPGMAKGKPKRAFWIDGNMHAREWASSHTALFIINQLVANYGRDPFLTNALNRLDFFIVPCANPDGFEFSRSSMNPKIRLWRKNRSPEQCTRTWSGLLCCRGVDLNRNFDFHWAETGSSLNACSNLFAGKRAFSEPEANAIANFLQADELRGRLDAFITLHTYAQMWIHPFSHEYQLYPADVQKLKSLALRATSRLKEIYGTTYRVGTGADLLAPASGGSDDWAKETLGVKFVYLVELRPQLDLSNGFILRQEELLPTAYETFEAIKEVIRGVLLENGMPTSLATNASAAAAIGGGGIIRGPNGGGGNISSSSALPLPLTSSTMVPSESEASTTLASSFKSTFSSTNASIQMHSILPTISSQFSTKMQQSTTTITNSEASIQTTKTLILPTNTTMISKSTIGAQKVENGNSGKGQKVDDNFNVFPPTSSPSLPKSTDRSQQRIFTLPWVPTRRVAVVSTPSMMPGGKWAHQPTTTLNGGNQQQQIPSSSSTLSTTKSSAARTVLFTGTEPAWEETNEIDVLPTQMTPPPLLRTADKFLGSDSLRKFAVHRWERTNGKLVELKEFGDNLLALLDASGNSTILKETTTAAAVQTVPLIISWPTRKCSDEKSSCAFWIRAHRPVCLEQRRFMQRNCAFSCGFCRIGN